MLPLLLLLSQPSYLMFPWFIALVVAVGLVPVVAAVLVALPIIAIVTTLPITVALPKRPDSNYLLLHDCLCHCSDYSHHSHHYHYFPPPRPSIFLVHSPILIICIFSILTSSSIIWRMKFQVGVISKLLHHFLTMILIISLSPPPMMRTNIHGRQYWYYTSCPCTSAIVGAIT